MIMHYKHNYNDANKKYVKVHLDKSRNDDVLEK